MYQEHFGFRVLPFVSAPDPQFFYLNPVYQEALATLRHGVLGKKGIIVLTGEVGTGKTTLLRKLFHDLGSSVGHVWIINSGVTVVDALRTMLAELGLACENAERLAMIDALHGYLIQSADEGRITCLIIDEAQSLDSETLEGVRQLSNLEADRQKLLQIFLVGQPELEKTLGEPELRPLKQRVALHCHLVPLTRSEVSRYIEFQLQAAGYQGVRLFDLDTMARIAYYSRGIPRLVNTICDNALLAAYRCSRKEVSSDLVDEVAQDLRLVRNEQSSMAVAIDGRGWVDRREVAPESQIDAPWSNLRFDRAPGQGGVTVPSPRRRLINTMAVVLFVLIALGTVGGAMYVEEATPYLEYLKSQGEVVKAWFGAAVVSAKRESSNESSRQQPREVGINMAAVDGAHTDIGAVSETIILGALKESEPAPQEAPKKGAETVPETSAEKAPTPVRPPAKSRPAEDPLLNRRLLEIEIHKAIQNRAIDGVTVTLIDGTAYLDGRVASDRQKSLAEQAALAVTTVEKVENRIRIEP
jgi:general secretion pathway protein A